MIQLTFLGVGNAFNHLGLGYQSILLRWVNKKGENQQVLLDCGPTAIQQLIAEGIHPNNISAVFLTHFHGDHAGGIPFLLLHRKYMPQGDTPLHLIGGTGLKNRMMKYLEAHYPSLNDWLNEGNNKIIFHEIVSEETRVLPTLGISFETVAIPHQPESWGYRIHVNDKIIAISGDTRPTENLKHLADNASVFIIECSTMESIPADHVSWDWLKNELESWNASRIVFIHYADDVWDSRELITKTDSRIIIARDGKKLILE